MHLLTWVATAAVGASSLVSAQGDVTRFLPEKPSVRLQVAGPARLAQTFAGCNLCAMLQSDDAADMWSGMAESVLSELDSDSDLPPEFSAVLEKLGGELDEYAGHLSVGFDFDPLNDEARPNGLVSVVLTPDDATDLEAVASLLGDAIGESDAGPIAELVTHDGSTVEVANPSEDLRILLPSVLDGHLVLAFGSERALEDFVAVLGDSQRTGSVVASDLHLSVDETLLPDFFDILESETPIPGAIFKEIFAGLGSFSLEASPSGERVEVRAVLEYDADVEDGLVPRLLPSKIERSPLLALAPREPSSISTFSVDFDGLLDLISAVTEQATKSMTGGFKLEEQAEAMLGLRLREDVFSQLDGDILYVDESDDADPERGMSVVLALGTRDCVALRATLDRVLRERGLHAAAKKKDYREVEIREMILGFTVTWAFLDSTFLLGVGPKSGATLRSMIDAATDTKDGVQSVPWNSRVATRLDELDDAWKWLSVVDGSGQVESWIDEFEAELQGDGAVVPESILAGFGTYMRLLDRFDLMTYVSGTAFERGRIVQTMIW